jgi:hypothetical protein
VSELTESPVTSRVGITLRIALILLVLVVGCRTTPIPQPPTSSPTAGQQPGDWPKKLSDFRFRWSAEPGFELTTGQAVPLRAYLESRLIVSYTDDVAAAYPGFERATPAPLEPGAPELMEIPYAQREIRMPRGPSKFDDPNQRIVGNEELYVLRTEPTPDGFRALVCDATFNTYKQAAGEAQYVPIMSYPGFRPTDYENMKVWRIEFSDRDARATSAPPAAPSRPQSGPLPAPRTDVFGPWFVTGAIGVAGWSDSDYPDLLQGTPEQQQRFREAQDAEAAMRQRCLDRYPLDAVERAALATTVIDKPPTVEPALPGWPE